MVIQLIGLWVIFYALAFCFIYMLRRNDQVANYRREINNKVFYASIVDTLRDKDPKWRRDVFRSVGYQTMFLKFWIKIEDFYKDKAFITIDGDLEADLRVAAKQLIEDKMPHYFRGDAKLNLDAGISQVIKLLEIYAPVLADIKKDKE